MFSDSGQLLTDNDDQRGDGNSHGNAVVESERERKRALFGRDGIAIC